MSHIIVIISNMVAILMSVNSTQEDLENGEDVAECPSCSLIVKVIYDPVSRSGAYPTRQPVHGAVHIIIE